ncbi:MAG TPA: response regulator [Gemmatimonadales bacterium]|nr:response regulator [Gemmatimonadales bacterium]
MSHADPIVFVVDDDSAVRTALVRLLRTAGFAADGFASAEELLARAEPDRRPGCLILDLRMPGRGGLELQRTLPAAFAHLPIVFLTAHADADCSERAMQTGAVDFLTKPASEEALLGAVRTAIEQSRNAIA